MFLIRSETGHRISRSLFALLLIAGGLTLWAETARACSCAAGDPWEQLGQADAAFVGVLIEDPRDDVPAGSSTAFEVTWTFHVEQAVKGDLESVIEVFSPLHGASCGFELAVGQRWGIFLHRDGEAWTGGLCTQIDPDVLLEVAGQPKEPNGENPAALLIGVRHHDARLLALDREGRTLAYGYGPGEVLDVDICPGAERAVEYVRDGAQRRIAVRELHSFEVVDEIRRDVPFDTLAVSCRNLDASDLIVFAGAFHASSAPDVRILRFRDGSWEEIYAASRAPECFTRIAFHPKADLAYLTGGDRCHDLLTVDLVTGEEQWLAAFSDDTEQLDLIVYLELSPNGSHLGAVVYETEYPVSFRLLMVNLGTDPASFIEAAFEADYYPQDLVWIDGSTVLLSGYGDRDQGAMFLSTELAVAGHLPDWHAERATVIDDVLYGQSWHGTIIATELPDGTPRTMRELPNPEIRAIVGLPGGVVIEPVASVSSVVAPTFTAPADPSPTSQEAEATSTATHASRWERVAGAGLITMLVAVGIRSISQRRRDSTGSAQ